MELSEIDSSLFGYQSWSPPSPPKVLYSYSGEGSTSKGVHSSGVFVAQKKYVSKGDNINRVFL